ncbi:MAG: SelT/SelW/SelH family protein [Tissierellia bacterium]|nr:SelT/SelW/SelH family protein [Tissierellia bacterium]
MLTEHKNGFKELTLIPSEGGVLEVVLNDELVWSKKELDRYPEKGEVEEIVKNKLKH